MLIRSQDKKVIFDMTGSNIEIGLDNKIYGYGNSFNENDLYTFLGKYTTKERAIEVLNEICNYYKSNVNGVFQMPEV